MSAPTWLLCSNCPDPPRRGVGDAPELAVHRGPGAADAAFEEPDPVGVRRLRVDLVHGHRAPGSSRLAFRQVGGVLAAGLGASAVRSV
jgi:hypothetical protein